jgi:NADPH-dependent 2,4-dienoyl-CoA reductase/sulfur reductase-like enzyme
MRYRNLLLLSGLITFGFCNVTQAENLYYYQKVDTGKPKLIDCDVVAYGGTPASFTATLQAARMGKRAILVSNNGFVGGLTSGGLTAVDWGARRTIGGIAQEFFARARPLKPSVAERTFLKMLSEAGVEVLLDRFLTAVEMRKGKTGLNYSRDR